MDSDLFIVGVGVLLALILFLGYSRSDWRNETKRVNFRYSLLPPEEKLIYLAEHEMDISEMNRLVKVARGNYQSATDGISPIMATVRKLPGRKDVSPLRRLKILCKLAQRMPEDQLRDALNLQDHRGYTALMHAVESSDEEGVRLLLYLGADKTIKNNKGETASTIARSHPAISELMTLDEGEGRPDILDPKLAKLLKSFKGSLTN